MANVSKKEFEALAERVDLGNKRIWQSVALNGERIDKLREDVTDANDAASEALRAVVAHLSRRHPDNCGLLAALEARLTAAEKAGNKSIADLSARVDALARTVGRIAEDLEAPREKPTPPKPKCPWCGGEAEWTARANHPIVGGEMITEHVCANTKCNRAFWV